jgi:hypothetical protein
VLVGTYQGRSRLSASTMLQVDGIVPVVMVPHAEGWALEVLPTPEPTVGTVVLDYCGYVWQKCDSGAWRTPLVDVTYSTLDELDAAFGPLTLLEVAHA